MKELDVVMTIYLESHYATASEAEKIGFKALLEMPDPDLYAILLGKQSSSNQAIDSLARSIRTMASHS